MNKKKIMSHLKRLLLNRNSSGNIKYNLLAFLLIGTMIFLPDAVLVARKIIGININIPIVTIGVLCCFLLTFVTLPIALFVAIFYFATIFGNCVYISFSGVPVNPDDIVNCFRESGDILESLSMTAWFMPFVIVPFALFLFVAIKYRKRMMRFFVCDAAIIFAFCWMMWYGYNMNMIRAMPKPTRTSFHNVSRVFPYTITHLWRKEDAIKYPDESSGVQIKLVNKNSPRLVVVIWGESTNWPDMSFLNKDLLKQGRDTTPKIRKMVASNPNNFLAIKGFSGGVGTLASTPIFFNLLHHPHNLSKTLQKQQQNLFKMAKENGYKTHWISSQENNNVEYGGIVADNVVTSMGIHALKIKKEGDWFLLDLFKNLDLSQGKHFVVIQFKTPHLPYSWNYRGHPEFVKFKDLTDKVSKTRAEYHNAILMTDELISKTIEYSKQNGADYILYTADHGDLIGSDGEAHHAYSLFGHSALTTDVSNVPGLVYVKKADKKLFDKLNKMSFITHYEMANLVANWLGYEVINPNYNGKDFYLYGPRIEADYQMLCLRRDGKGGWTETFKGTAQELAEKQKIS
ncbi:MAG: sulfatase-like hydrolase/transferase [Rickettsiales bacterium]|nr:sulfatase-like hydrolase/transferase [Rickettsiales bacterium]